MSENKFRSAYDGVRHRSCIKFLDEDGNQAVGRTEQSHKADCDINVVLRRYDKTGLITHVNNATAQYGDFTEVNEYQENLNMVIAAQQAFEELPSDIRKKFGNDPGNFFEFATNPDNKDKMIEYGLANPEAVIDPIMVQIAESTASVDSSTGTE